ncbi:hypothetical protein HDV05_002407 [Chytridiales sp. JEL 0842]|nr:hypothetical protein HDV05_002407 [Chytridiales sp. JEL 0842]
MTSWKPTLDVKETDDKLEVCYVKPTQGDYIYATVVLTIGLLIITVAHTEWLYTLAAIVPVVYLAYGLIDYTYVAILDKKKGLATVTKTKLGRLSYKRVAPLDELVQVEIVEDEITRKRKGSAVEMVFMSQHGYYRLRLAETLTVGEENIKLLHEVKSIIHKYMKLRQNPFTEELLGKERGKGKKKTK